MKYILTYREYVLCTDGKWRHGGFAENERFFDRPVDVQLRANEIRTRTSKDIKIKRGNW